MERVEKLGQMGDVVKVKAGYARNFLLPQNKAKRATKENLARFETERAQLEAASLASRGEAEQIAKKIEGLSVIVTRQAGEAGQLYGSVTAGDIAKAVTGAGFTVERRQVSLASPIKSIGLHLVRIDLHPEISVSVTANVARSDEEAKIQAKTGAAHVANDQQEAPVPTEDLPPVPTELLEEEVAEALVKEASESDAGSPGSEGKED